MMHRQLAWILEKHLPENVMAHLPENIMGYFLENA